MTTVTTSTSSTSLDESQPVYKTFSPSQLAKALKDLEDYSKVKIVNIIFDRYDVKRSTAGYLYVRHCMIKAGITRLSNTEISELLGFDCVFISLKNNQVAALSPRYKYHFMSVDCTSEKEYSGHKYFSSSLQYIRKDDQVKQIDAFRYTVPELKEFNLDDAEYFEDDI